ncbi:MAG TPA: hypothetical protein VNM90_01885 [Haliangium sp.]|nr:hypothetical protein [Haliangium sp.]
MSSVEPPVFHSGSLSYTADFSEPAFELMHAGPVLQRHVFLALRDFEIDPALMQEIATPIGPSYWNLSAGFLGLRASLKLHVGNIQVTFISDLVRDAALVKKVLHSIEHAVLQVVPTVSFAQRQIVQQVHCRLSMQGVHERISPYTGGMTEELGIPAGRAAGFYFTSPLFTGEAAVVLDKSAVLDQGLYVEVRCRFHADSFDLVTSCDNFQSYLAKVDHAFHLNGTVGEFA